MALLYPISASQTDANSPVDQTLMDALRLNLEDHESRLSGVQSIIESNIYDEFTYASGALDADIWDAGFNAVGYAAPTNSTAGGSHYVEMSSVPSTAGQRSMAGGNKKARVYLGADQRFIFEGRIVITAAGTGGRRLLFGLQDASFGVSGANAILTDVSDFIGFREGTNNSTLKFTMQKGGASGASVDNIDFSAWTTVKVDIESASGVYTVHAYVGGVEISGSPFSTNVPDTTLLRIAVAAGNDSGSGNAITWRHDRVLAYWNERPDSP